MVVTYVSPTEHDMIYIHEVIVTWRTVIQYQETIRHVSSNVSSVTALSFHYNAVTPGRVPGDHNRIWLLPFTQKSRLITNNVSPFLNNEIEQHRRDAIASQLRLYYLFRF